MCAENTSSFVHAFWLQKITVCQEASMGLGVLSKLGFPERLPVSRAFPGWVTWRCWHPPEASDRFPAISEWGRAGDEPVLIHLSRAAMLWSETAGPETAVRLCASPQEAASCRGWGPHQGSLLESCNPGATVCGRLLAWSACRGPATLCQCLPRGVMSRCLWPHGR